MVGVPFDGGCTYRAGTRFGPQGIRRISALYTPYNYEKGIDLREQMVRATFTADPIVSLHQKLSYQFLSEYFVDMIARLYAISGMYLLYRRILKRASIRFRMRWHILLLRVLCQLF